MRKVLAATVSIAVCLFMYLCSIVKADSEVNLYTVYGEIETISDSSVNVRIGKLQVEKSDFFASKKQPTIAIETIGDAIEIDVETINSSLSDDVYVGEIVQIVYTETEDGEKNIMSISQVKENEANAKEDVVRKHMDEATGSDIN